jgi:hypothetical protein
MKNFLSIALLGSAFLMLPVAAQSQDIEAKGGDTITVKAGDKSDDATVTGNRAKTPCDDYPEFKMPGTSAYVFPPGEKQSGAQRILAGALKMVEADLVKHLTACNGEWTRQSVLEWDTRRHTLIAQLLELERRYALAFTYPNYTDNEDRILAQAYKDSANLKRAASADKALFEKYAELQQRAEEMIGKYRYASDSATQLNLRRLIYEAKKARDAWWVAANRIVDLRGPKMKLLKKVNADRLKRGLSALKEIHSDSVIELHEKNDYLRTSSPLLKKLLGPAGMEILEGEGGRRIAAMRGQ